MVYPTPETLAGWATACVAFVGTALALWRRKSKTELEVKKDNIEGRGLEDVFARMTMAYTEVVKERDAYRKELHEAYELRIKDREAVARLTQENDTMRRQVQELQLSLELTTRRVTNLMRIIRSSLPPEEQQKLSSDFGDLIT